MTKSNIDLAQEAGLYLEDSEHLVDRLIALAEQRKVAELMGVQVEPAAWLFPDGQTYAGGPDFAQVYPEAVPLYTAESVAALVAQAMPKRLTREQVKVLSVANGLGIKDSDHG